MADRIKLSGGIEIVNYSTGALRIQRGPSIAVHVFPQERKEFVEAILALYKISENDVRKEK